MTKVFASAVLSLGLLLGSVGFAHEGHDHDAPAGLKAPKGGVIKGLEQTNVEVVSKGKELKIYLYDKELKAKSTEGFKVTAIAEIPRKKGTHVIEIKDMKDHFVAEFDAKGAHRYSLKLSVLDPAEGHEDSMNFSIEPRK